MGAKVLNDCDGLIDEEQAIEFLGLGSRPNPKGSLRWLCRTRRFAYIDVARGIRRFRREDLQEYIDGQRVSAKPVDAN
jgi:hypothetical protein